MKGSGITEIRPPPSRAGTSRASRSLARQESRRGDPKVNASEQPTNARVFARFRERFGDHGGRKQKDESAGQAGKPAQD
jgi:hypothetical protein